MNLFLLLVTFFFVISLDVNAQDWTSLTYDELDKEVEVQYDARNYSDAILISKEMLTREELIGRDTAKTEILNLIGRGYYYLGQLEEAKKTWEKSKDLLEKCRGKEHPKYALVLNSLAIYYFRIGDYKKAESLWLETVRIKFKVTGGLDEDYAMSLNNLGALYSKIGDYKKTMKYYSQALKIRKKNFDPTNVKYAMSLNNMANLYKKMGNYEEAEPLQLEAIRIYELVYGKSHPDYLTTINNLAILYEATGRYEEALSWNLQAREGYLKNYGKEHHLYGMNLNNLALLYSKMGKHHEAEVLYLESLDIRGKTLGKKHIDYASSLSNLAITLQDLNKNQKAISLLLEAREIYGQKFGYDNVSYAQTQHQLASLYVAIGDFEKAKKLAEEALIISKKRQGEQHPFTIEFYTSLANINFQMENFDAAQGYFIKALNANIEGKGIVENFNEEELAKLSEYTYRFDGPAVSTLSGIYNYYKARYNTKGVPDDLKRSFLIVHEILELNAHVRNSFNSQNDKLQVLSSNAKYASYGIQTALELTNLDTTNQDYIVEAFAFAEQNKSILLADALKGQRARTLSDLPDSMALEEVDLQQYKKELQKELLEIDQKDWEDPNEKANLKAEVLSDINKLNTEIDIFLKQLKKDYPQYHQMKYENITAKVQDIQAILDEKTLLLEYLVTENRLFIFVISNKNVQLLSTNIVKSSLDKEVMTLLAALSDYNFILSNEDKAKEILISKSSYFYKLLLEKALAGKAAHIENLIVIPDGVLSYLPFEIFLTERGLDQKPRYEDLQYVLKKYNVSYNFSATLFADAQNIGNKQTKKEMAKPGQILACVGTYNPIDSLELLELRSIYTAALRGNLKSLPAAQEELNALSKRFYGEFLTGDAANEAYFKANANQYSIIHLAMHGILNTRVPILSSLAFSENKDSLEDNFLQAYEIAHLHLNAELVVLSACETAVGQFKQGEGVVSLARSFMYAGVPSMVVSLWQVNDASTSMIMESFYQHLAEGLTKDAALRQAKLAYIKSVKGTAQHPAFWSPFIQLGDSHPIEIATKGFAWLGWGIGIVLLVGLGFVWRRRQV